ncbi:MAG: hypothetical protein PUE64_14495, partial [Firmicutes bacterium]|nr:hypothetical protein [Bacillota bacterium]
RFLSDNPAYPLEEYFLLENDTPSAEEEKTQGSETDAKTLPESEEKTWFFPGPAGSDADYSIESLWVHSPQFIARTKQFLVTPDTPLFVSAANQKVNMSDWQRQGGQNFIVRTAWFLQGDRTLRNQTGSPRRLGTSDSGSRMLSTTMQAGNVFPDTKLTGV